MKRDGKESGKGIGQCLVFDGDEFPMLVVFVEFVAAFFEFAAIIHLEGCRRHDNNLAIGFEALGNGDGGTRFTGTESVIDEETAVR